MSERWPYPRLIAHRGGGTLAPENTLAAIRTGIAYGYRAVEFDAMLAADGVAVLMHDATLQRTGLREGDISAMPASELATVDVGRWHSPAFAGETVPTLMQALQLCRARGVWANVEIKPAPGHDEATGAAVAKAVAQAYCDLDAGSPQRPLLSSFSRAALQAARSEAPGIARGWLLEQVPDKWRDAAADLGIVALHTDHRCLDRQRAQEIVDAGFGLFCYTVNDAARAQQLYNWGVDAICTDRIDLIRP